MSKRITITEEYFKQYRQKLGFTSQSAAENFFAAKDIIPKVDLHYINMLNAWGWFTQYKYQNWR